MDLNNEELKNDSDTTPEEITLETSDPSVLEINVHDKVAGKSVGPGQN